MHSKRIDIRWRDLDAYQHVNSGVYMTYLEEIVDDWLRHVFGLPEGAIWDYVTARAAIDYFFDDETIPGTQGLPLDLLRGVEPFPTREVVPYDTAFLSGHVIEHYRVVLLEAAEQSQQKMMATLEALCGQQVPGDTYRNLRISPQFSGRTFKHVLVPVWLLSYDYGAKAFQVLVNGYTGKIAGRCPRSVWKILLVVVLAILVALAVMMLSSEPRL